MKAINCDVYNCGRQIAAVRNEGCQHCHGCIAEFDVELCNNLPDCSDGTEDFGVVIFVTVRYH